MAGYSQAGQATTARKIALAMADTIIKYSTRKDDLADDEHPEGPELDDARLAEIADFAEGLKQYINMSQRQRVSFWLPKWQGFSGISD